MGLVWYTCSSSGSAGLGKSLLEIGQEMKERQQGVVLEKRREHRFEFGAEMTRIPTSGEKTEPGDQEQK